MNKIKKVKILNLQTNEETIYKSALEAGKDLGVSYTSIMSWVHGRTKNDKYKASFITNEL